ncbi:MAG: CNNM domain-containing protein [Planctomycetota bacterium]|jgi:CBS domain containing-hemolysin-like protein
MSAIELIAYGLVVVIGLSLSALFSGLETGVYTINRVRLRVRADRGERAPKRLQREMSKPARLLATLLIGNNIANYLGTFGVAAILDGIGFTPVGAVAINASLLVPLLFVFGETLPKDLFRTHTDRWTYLWSSFLAGCRRLFTGVGLIGIVQAFGTLVTRLVGGEQTGFPSSRQRISRLIKEGVGAGALSESQTTLADRALATRSRTVATEMVPWANVVTLALEADRAGREALMRRCDFTRFPVVDAAGRVVGILSALDALLAPDEPTGGLMVEPLCFRAATPLREALRALRARHQAMAVAVDADSGRPQGLVTLKDLVEPITGELEAW